MFDKERTSSWYHKQDTPWGGRGNDGRSAWTAPLLFLFIPAVISPFVPMVVRLASSAGSVPRVADSLAHPPSVAYAIAGTVLTESVGPRLWHIPAKEIAVATFDHATVRVYPEPLEPYFLSSTVHVPGSGWHHWKCNIYYLFDPGHTTDRRSIDWIVVDGKKVLDNGESCCGSPGPKW